MTYTRNKVKLNKKIKSKKIRGGSDIDTDKKEDTNMTKEEEQIKEDHPGIIGIMPNLDGSGGIVHSAMNLAGNAVEGVSDFFDIDLTNQDNSGVEYLKDLQNNPVFEETLEEAAKTAEVVLDAAAPVIEKVSDKVIDVGARASEKVVHSGIQIALNTAEAIPGVGVVVGAVRDIDQGAKAVQAVINAGEEIVMETADGVNLATQRYNQLVKEKSDTITSTEKSVKDFQKGGVIFKYKYKSRKIKHKKNKKRNTKKIVMRYRR
jgi:hypothetical protein